MDKDELIKTAVTHWDDEDGCYVTASPLSDRIVGAGATAEESEAAFETMVDAAIEMTA